MSDQARDIYRVYGSKNPQELENQLNMLFSRLSDRLDRMEGLRGNPRFYKTIFDLPGAAMSTGQVLRATGTEQAEVSSLDVAEVVNAAPAIPSGNSAQIDIERSLISLIDAENDTVVHQFPTQWLEYNSEVFMFTTNESFQELAWATLPNDIVIDSIADADTTHAPSRNSVFDALALKLALSLGSANLKAFMNSGATAAEWAAGMFQGSFTKDLTEATGSTAYTGVGFKPSALIILALLEGNAAHSIGLAFGTNDACLAVSYLGLTIGGAGCINLTTAVGAYQTATIGSMDSDGFTINWTKGGLPIGTADILYLALR